MENKKTNQTIEHLLRTTYRKRLWTPFIRALKDYELIKGGDHIAVAISGGKDSFLLAKLFQELHRHGNRNFSLTFLALDPGYREENLEKILENAQHLQIPIQFVKKDVFRVASSMDERKPCFLCARMRRGILYENAQKLGCNKVALGHHFDDVIETIMMNILSCGTYMSMMPKIKSKNYENMELIRPLYYVRERNIVAFTKACALEFLDCACEVSSGEKPSNRKKVKELIANLSKDFVNVEHSIFRSSVNVQKDAILGWKQKGIQHSFLEDYQKDLPFEGAKLPCYNESQEVKE